MLELTLLLLFLQDRVEILFPAQQPFAFLILKSSFSPYLICSVDEQRKNPHSCNFFLNFALCNGKKNLVVTEDK
jgi:hypothetical protein